MVGWGRTSEGGNLPNIVQEVEVPILTPNQCKAMKYRASRITSYMLCAGRGAMDSCQGDSGGPLLVHNGDKYEIVGRYRDMLDSLNVDYFLSVSPKLLNTFLIVW